MMAVDEPDNPSESTPREAELQRQLDGLQSQLEQSAEKFTQLESVNLVLRDKNQALNTVSNKKRRFHTQVRSMPSLDKPNTTRGTARQPSDEAGASGEKAGRESMKQYPATPSQTSRRKHLKEPRHCSPH
ncbi:hypothetical protein F2Q70_00038383 [Brassica cretica]|uniref:Uncharacterized protein n=1 Tax=Brassica cretica TaxID=69181 RepID=A0A8S9K5C4_BRACR|nr:hypothetical protein F2Q70_00038383 [Brassica cretica]